MRYTIENKDLCFEFQMCFEFQEMLFVRVSQSVVSAVHQG